MPVTQYCAQCGGPLKRLHYPPGHGGPPFDCPVCKILWDAGKPKAHHGVCYEMDETELIRARWAEAAPASP